MLALPLACPAAPNPQVEKVAMDNTAFAISLYQKEEARPGNLFFSPYSISTALAMTYAGARGETAQEMASVLHFSLPPTQLPQAFAGLARQFEEISATKAVSLSIANSLWCQQSYHFAEAFLKLTRDFYGAEAKEVDFANNFDGVRQEINSWVAQKTQDKIRNLLQPGQVSSATRLVLCNAVYFKGKWVFQFDPKATHPAPFYVLPEQPIQTPMMFRSMDVRSVALDGFDIFTLPYTSNMLSMVILLPNAKDGLGALERQLNAAQLSNWLGQLDAAHETKTDVFMPKFKLDCRLELTRDLAAMGMPTAFGPRADFSGMTGKPDLYIGVVVHQAMVDVNEEGTEAAAATAVGVRMLAVQRKPPAVLRVDHPFLFMIRENQTGSVLFLGRVLDPSR